MQLPTNEMEYAELARALERFAECAPAIEAPKLVPLWSEVESRLLARVRIDEHHDQRPLLQSEGQLIRNLAWEIGVSLDLDAVHLGAVRTLANRLRERGRQLARLAAPAGRGHAPRLAAQTQVPAPNS